MEFPFNFPTEIPLLFYLSIYHTITVEIFLLFHTSRGFSQPAGCPDKLVTTCADADVEYLHSVNPPIFLSFPEYRHCMTT